MIACTSCGRDNPESFKFCLDCGSDLSHAPLQGEKPKSAFRVQTGTFEKYAVTETPPSAPFSSLENDAPIAAAGRQEAATAAPQAPPPAPQTAPAAPPTLSSAERTPDVDAEPETADPAVFGVTHDPGTSPYDVSGTASGEAPAEVAPSDEDEVSQVVMSPNMLGASGPSAEHIRCPSCETEFSVPTKFCSNCGKRLDGAGTPGQAAPGAKRTMFMHAAQVQSHKEPTCRLISIAEDGSEGTAFTLRTGETACGRTNGIVLLFDNPFVSPTHCEFSFHGGTLAVTDAQSLNGVFIRLQKEMVLRDGDHLRIGKQLLRFETLDHIAGAKGGARANPALRAHAGTQQKRWGSPAPTGAFGRLVQILPNGQLGECRVLAGESVDVGREQGNIVFPTDAFVSGRHCTFFPRADDVVVKDLGSANGTHIRIRERTTLRNGDFVSVGHQLLRIEIQ